MRRASEEAGVRTKAPIGVIVDSSRNPTLRTLRSGAGSLSQPVSLGGFGSGLAEQASWNVDQRESSSLLWQFVGVGFHDYLDSFVAGVDCDPHGAIFKIDFVLSARFAADDGMGHLRACGRYEILARSFSTRLSVEFREESTMTPKSLKEMPATFNARAETIAEKP